MALGSLRTTSAVPAVVSGELPRLFQCLACVRDLVYSMIIVEDVSLEGEGHTFNDFGSDVCVSDDQGLVCIYIIMYVHLWLCMPALLVCVLRWHRWCCLAEVAWAPWCRCPPSRPRVDKGLAWRCAPPWASW